MRMCQIHWLALREAIAGRGLSHFVSQGGKAAAEALQAGAFDPLMGSYLRIINNVLRTVGPKPFFQQTDVCPLCELERHHEANCHKPSCDFQSQQWIDIAANEALDEARTLGLVLPA